MNWRVTVAEGAQDRDAPRSAVDLVVDELRLLRERAGSPSYGEIVRRIGERRRATRPAEEAAAPAKTTIYSAFTEGRRRIDARLVGEIAAALDATDAELERLGVKLEGASSSRATRRPEPPAPVVDAASPAPPEQMDAARMRVRPGFWIAAVAAGIAMNLLGHTAAEHLRFSLFLDMIGTAFTALALGPWAGVVVAVSSHLTGSVVNNPMAFPFTLVNIAGALVWGYGARSPKLTSTLGRFAGLNVLTALACSAVAVPIILFLLGGETGHTSDAGFAAFGRLGEPIALAVVSTNLITSISDKLLTGFLVLMLLLWLRRRFPSFHGSSPALGGALEQLSQETAPLGAHRPRPSHADQNSNPPEGASRADPTADR